jgi:hypothetical protein
MSTMGAWVCIGCFYKCYETMSFKQIIVLQAAPKVLDMKPANAGSYRDALVKMAPLYATKLHAQCMTRS